LLGADGCRFHGRVCVSVVVALVKQGSPIGDGGRLERVKLARKYYLQRFYLVVNQASVRMKRLL
jgi:hypothetical protein